MADQLYFSRDTKVYLEQDANIWGIPILNGYSFSQSTNTSEVTLNEMAASDGTSRRGRQMFTDSYAPAEWSFTTYVRPFVSQVGATDGWEPDTAMHHAVEEALWANFVALNSFTPGTTGVSDSSWAEGVTSTPTGMTIDFTGSNKSELGTFDLYFCLGACSNALTKTNYKVSNCVVGSVSISFDIDGIATIEWSGQGTIIEEVATEPTPTITEATQATSNFIRNRLTSLTVTAADTTTFPGESNDGVYNVVLTGGSINFENNITFLTPEVLCTVNHSIGAVTGTRSISGSFTAYLNAEVGSTGDLFEDIIGATQTITNSFALKFSVGGSNVPRIEFNFPQCHLEVPSHSIDDVIAVETNFHALPSDISQTDEATIVYTGDTY
jgi:hypothetical protein